MDGLDGRRWGDGENVGARLAVVESRVDGIDEKMDGIFTAITRLSGRPSWGVATLIAVLVASNTATITILAAVLGRH